MDSAKIYSTQPFLQRFRDFQFICRIIKILNFELFIDSCFIKIEAFLNFNELCRKKHWTVNKNWHPNYQQHSISFTGSQTTNNIVSHSLAQKLLWNIDWLVQNINLSSIILSLKIPVNINFKTGSFKINRLISILSPLTNLEL